MSAEYTELRPITHYCRALPGSRGAQHLHPATITRWILTGVVTPAGRVRLAAKRIGSRWLIHEEDFEAFMDTLTERSLPRTDRSATLRGAISENPKAAEARSERFISAESERGAQCRR